MPDWTKSMQQTFEFYEVDPATWTNKKLLDTALSLNITWDLENETRGTASLSINSDIGECYIRTYLKTIQNGIEEKTALGTFLYQTPGYNYNGKVKEHSVDGYSPLIELKEKGPSIGYTVIKNRNILDVSQMIVRENVRAPVIEGEDSATVPFNFVSNVDDTWLIFVSDLLAYAKYSLGVDEMGNVLFLPEQEYNALKPVWTFDDSNSSILYPDMNLKRDLYAVPNVIEVVLTSDYSTPLYSRIVNDDPNSPISTVSRGREIVSRITNPELSSDNPTQAELDSYARTALKQASTLEYTVSYSHGYCPVRIGDCVLLNYRRAGLEEVKARVTRQKITCEPGCPVEETAVYTTSLWG